VLGGAVDVPTLDGEVALKIPQETQTGRVFRIRGKGVKPVRGGPSGDLLVRVSVETPVKLSKQQRALLKEFDESIRSSSVSHSPREHTWLDGVKAFFEKLGSATRD
jgi:molecular chaperone DnaJ